ncbi:MAG: hypothetical protein ACJAT7_002577 [Psychromonas sp.]|jgi:hypothetical protein|uniref:VC2046/SO_2500 family protein n=1 Tax=Psychromonas sp. TaxID=1884585 RepID=UPI0039E2A216
MKQIESGLLINEWQLGQQLNTAVHKGTREKFNLLLSLLSDDARDFAQFALPPERNESLAQAELRASLFLADPQPLVNKGISERQAASLNSDLHKKDLTSIRLKQLLSNEALLSRNESVDIPSEIIENLPLWSQNRLTAEQGMEQPITSLKPEFAEGVGTELMGLYQSLDLDNKPIKVTYM